MAASKPDLTVTTCKILSLAYATIFGITTDQGGGIGHYYGQYAGESCIDYAVFDQRYDVPFDDDADYFECVTESGCEGCWIRVDLVHYTGQDARAMSQYTRQRAGTIKTLCEGHKAWKDMGALAGELTYVANYDAAYKVIKRAKELAAENAKED